MTDESKTKLIEDLQDSPSFRELGEQALARDWAESQVQRETALRTLASVETWYSEQVAEIVAEQNAAAEAVREAKAALVAAQRKARTINSRSLHLEAEYTARRTAPQRILRGTLQKPWQEFAAELRDLLETNRQLAEVRGGHSRLLAIFGGRDRATSSNGEAVARRGQAIRETLHEVERLRAEFVGTEAEVLTKIGELRLAIPAEATVNEFLPTMETQLRESIVGAKSKEGQRKAAAVVLSR